MNPTSDAELPKAQNTKLCYCYIVSEPADKNHRANDATAQLGDCWNGRYHFCEFQPVQDRGLARCVQAKHQDAHVLGAQHPLPHLAEEHAHDAEVSTGTCYRLEMLEPNTHGTTSGASMPPPAPCHVMPQNSQQACHTRTMPVSSVRFELLPLHVQSLQLYTQAALGGRDLALALGPPRLQQGCIGPKLPRSTKLEHPAIRPAQKSHRL